MLSQSQSQEEITFFPEPLSCIVEETITSTQAGRVWFQASYWSARLYNSDDEVILTPKSSVTVVGRQGLTVLVDPYSSPNQISLFPEPAAGIVEETITPTQPGRVRFQCTSWPARFYNLEGEATLAPDDQVDVVGRQGVTLFVVPVSRQDSVGSPQPEREEDSRAFENTNQESPFTPRA